jgi:hypothetical protein
MSVDPEISPPDAQIPRPFSVTLLALGVLTIAALNITRSIETIVFRDFLSEFPAVPVLYLTLSGLFWGAAAIPLVWGLFTGKGWALRYTFFFSLAYTAYFWVDRLWLAAHTQERNIPFVAGINLFLLLFTWWILSRRKARSFFGDLYE